MTTVETVSDTTASRSAYETLEPFHVLAYFSPLLRDAQRDTGLDPHAFYVGARGAPLGACVPAVVTSTFYNFAPELIEKSWTAALDVGLDRVAARRDAMLDEQLRAILGDGADDPSITELTAGYRELAVGLPIGGRALAAGWSTATPPESSVVALWYAVAVLREWRGDNHIAALVLNGLHGVDAVAFHEAQLPDPTVKRRVLGRKLVQLTRGWCDDEWEAGVDRLVAAGLAERTDDGHRLSADGGALYDDIEATTDALGESLWSSDGAADLVERTRPIVKAVIDAGVLPGTKKKG